MRGEGSVREGRKGKKGSRRRTGLVLFPGRLSDSGAVLASVVVRGCVVGHLVSDGEGEVLDERLVTRVESELETDGDDNEDDHDRSLRDGRLLAVRTGEEEQAREADLLNVETCSRVERSVSSNEGRARKEETNRRKRASTPSGRTVHRSRSK
jgi:hypothetical protein